MVWPAGWSPMYRPTNYAVAQNHLKLFFPDGYSLSQNGSSCCSLAHLNEVIWKWTKIQGKVPWTNHAIPHAVLRCLVMAGTRWLLRRPPYTLTHSLPLLCQRLPQYSKSHREALYGCQRLPHFIVAKACYNILNVICIEWSLVLISNTLTHSLPLLWPAPPTIF